MKLLYFIIGSLCGHWDYCLPVSFVLVGTKMDVVPLL